MNVAILYPLIFIALYLFYNFRVDVGFAYPEVYITIASFLFAIFTGFFIARQNSRHMNLRQELAANDGDFTAIYRAMGQIDPKAQKEAGKIIKERYNKILGTNDWAYHIKHRSDTLIRLHALLKRTVGSKKYPSLKHVTLQFIMESLTRLQLTRKKLIAYYQEKMTKMQWSLIIVLTAALIISLSFLENTNFIVPFYKALYALIILIVVLYIYRLNNLSLFSDAFGKQSSRDVIEIIEGKK